MKKTTLLFAILCASALNGMEPERSTSMQNLPKDVQSLIIMHLNAGDTLESTIRNIVRMSQINTTFHKLVNDVYGNLKGFTSLVHALIIGNRTPSVIASKFKTPTSQTYLELAEKLFNAVRNNDTELITTLINNGADINYYKDPYDKNTPLVYAIKNKDANMVELLLKLGADPKLNESHAMETAKSPYNNFRDKAKKIQLLENAMNK